MKDQRDNRLPVVEWACHAIAHRLEEESGPLPVLPESPLLSPGDKQAAGRVAEAIARLPADTLQDRWSPEPTPEEWSQRARTFGDISRLAKQAEDYCAESGWVDFARIAGLLALFEPVVHVRAFISKAGLEPSSFAHWHEQAGGWLPHPESAGPHPREIIGDGVSSLQGLLDLSLLLEMKWLVIRLEKVVLSVSEKAILLAVREGRWDDAITYRSDHLCSFHHDRTRARQRREVRPPDHLWGALGASLAVIQRQAASAFDIFRQDSGGPALPDWLKSFQGFPSAAALEIDMSIAFRGKTAVEWGDFMEGYLEYSASAREVTDELRQLARPEGDRWPDEYHGADDLPPLPAYSVRLCTHAMVGRDGTRQSHDRRLAAMKSVDSVEQRCRLAARLIGESHGLDDDVLNEAGSAFFMGFQELFHRGDYRTVVELGETALYQVAEILAWERSGILAGFAGVARAQLQADPDAAARCLLDAGRSFEKTRRRDAGGLMLGAFRDAMQSTAERETYSRSAVAVITTLFLQAIFGEAENAAAAFQQLAEEPIATGALDPEAAAAISACRLAADAWRAGSLTERTNGLRAVLEASEGNAELDSIRPLWRDYLELLERPESAWVTPDALMSPELPEDTREALAGEDWVSLFFLSRRDLAMVRQQRATDRAAHGRTVALLARSLQRSAAVGYNLQECAEEARGLLLEYGSMFLEAPAATAEDRCRWAAHCSDLGFSAVWLGRFMRGDTGGVFGLAVELLKHAVTLSSPAERPVEYGTYLHDLGHALTQLSHLVPSEARGELAAHSAAIFRESLAIYHALRARPEYAEAMSSRLEEVDYINLASVHVRLGHHYASGLDHEFGFPVSGLCFRSAFCLLAKARDVALEARRPEAAHTCMALAEVGIQMAGSCLEHTRANRGAFRRDFQYWIHAIEGHVISTWDFANRYAIHAMGAIGQALEIAHAIRDEGLLHRAARGLLGIWHLAEMRHGVEGGPILFDDNRWNMAPLREYSLISIAKILPQIEAAADAGRDGSIAREAGEYRRYFQALLRIELFQKLGGQVELLAEAREEFLWLSENGNLVSRGLARPWTIWLAVEASTGSATANGLLIGRAGDALEIRINAQRRSFLLPGVSLDEVHVQLRESSWVKTHCLPAIAYLEPQVNWAEVPALTPALVANCKAGQASFKLLAVRLPTSSWDTWVFHLKKDSAGELVLTLPFKYVGRYDRKRQHFSGTASTSIETGEDVLMFEHDQLVLEVSARYRGEETEGSLSVRPDGAVSHLAIGMDEVVFSLRTSPQIVPSNTAMLVKSDRPWGAACCVASFPAVAPSLTTPTAMMRAFGPLFFFDTAIPNDIQAHFRKSSYREVFLVGIPGDPEELDATLDLLFDPRRDLFLLVEPAELDIAEEAVQRLRNRGESSLGSSLLALATSIDEHIDPFERIQIVGVSRSLAPAAAQILLDLMERRRLPIEDIAAALASVQLLGNPGGILRAITQLPGTVGWEELAGKYVELVRDWPLKRKDFPGQPPQHYDRLIEVQTQGLAERPCILVPEDGHATLLATIPYARHLGAILLPDDEAGHRFCELLSPASVFCFNGSAWPQPANAQVLSPDSHDIAKRFSGAARVDHERRLAELLMTFPHAHANMRLSQGMAPTDYVVVASSSEEDPWPSFLAANYAAGLGSPLLLVDDSLLFSGGRAARQGDLLTGRFLESHSTRGELRHFVIEESASLTEILTESSREFDAALRELNPRYVSFVSSRVFAPLELSGTPPIATRHAVGRLAGPDLASTSLLITNAALGENAIRGSSIRAVIASAANAVAERPLPGARQEVDSLERLLGSFPDLRVARIEGADDLQRFLTEIEHAHIVHFAGHGFYDNADASQSSLVFEHGRLRAADLGNPLRGFPIVFGNACETGIAAHDQGTGRGWSGLAAAFIDAGAVNYIGTLWPVFDDKSCQLGGRFYALLSEGFSTGEALRTAREESYLADDPTWAAMVLFGCPRNRLRAPDGRTAGVPPGVTDASS